MRGDVGGRLRLSIFDHTRVSSGSTRGEAFSHSTRLAELPEHVAEHHNKPWLGSSSPSVLVRARGSPNHDPSRRLWWRNASQLCAAGGGRAVRQCLRSCTPVGST